ncbi:MAG: SAM-dependent methyltransferase [Magnetovibrio sp.]|nr:SAM-dependent methyltransferase [Magnetovibrio sp.]
MHLRITETSPWIKRFEHLVPKAARVLDVAAGGGRHGRRFLELGASVTFIDRDISGLSDLLNSEKARVIEADLETTTTPFDSGGHLEGENFDAIIVVNYLHRPLLGVLIESLSTGGFFLYETFARGNEKFARPRNPKHLLESGELLTTVAGKLQVIAYEHGQLNVADIPGVKQRLCAVKDQYYSTGGELSTYPFA